MTIRERVERLYKRNIDRLKTFSEESHFKGPDEDGSVLYWQVGANRTAAIARYVLYADVSGFRAHMKAAAIAQLRLFERFDCGDSIDDSYVTMSSYRVLLDALAGGASQEARALAELMGG